MDNFVEIGERLLLSICLPTLEAYQLMKQRQMKFLHGLFTEISSGCTNSMLLACNKSNVDWQV
jgi:hypothetical protein